MLITEPGIYPHVATNDYLADPCPDASLNASIAKVLVDRSPMHAWHAHPRLNPKWKQDNDTKFDVANVAHALLLGRGKTFVPAPFDSWTTKDAREFRKLQHLAGHIAVLDKHLDQARAMVGAARQQLAELGCPDAFGVDGASEVMAVANEGSIWLRCLIDWIAPGMTHAYDYKTTKGSASPAALEYKMAEDGWDIQAATQERILDQLRTDGVGRRRWRFVLQEAYPPFALTLAELPETVMEMGRRKLASASTLWRMCMQTGQWPSYKTGMYRPAYPSFKLQQWENRETEE